MCANKKGVSGMVGYVLLIIIAVSLAAIVYPFLKARLPEDRVECPTDLSISIEKAVCNLLDNTVTVKLSNRGLFNITGAFIRFAEADRSVRPQINTGKELILTGENNPRPLGPGQSTPLMAYPVIGISANKNFVVEVQPAIFQKKVLVPCSNKIVTQTIKCTSSAIQWQEKDEENSYSCEGAWDTSNNCQKIADEGWDTYGEVLEGLANYYVNYTTPANAAGSNWTVRYGNEEFFGVILPSNCWNTENLQFKIEINATDTTSSISRFFCLKNDGRWLSLHTARNTLPRIYEEKVWWKVIS